MSAEGEDLVPMTLPRPLSYLVAQLRGQFGDVVVVNSPWCQVGIVGPDLQFAYCTDRMAEFPFNVSERAYYLTLVERVNPVDGTKQCFIAAGTVDGGGTGADRQLLPVKPCCVAATVKWGLLCKAHKDKDVQYELENLRETRMRDDPPYPTPYTYFG